MTLCLYCMQSLYRTHQKQVDSAHRITPTLIALIILFTVLVTPSQFLVFMSLAGFSFYTLRTTVRIANCMLLFNFAINFVLYLAVNADFRHVAGDLVTCRCRHKRGIGGGGRTQQGVSPSVIAGTRGID